MSINRTPHPTDPSILSIFLSSPRKSDFKTTDSTSHPTAADSPSTVTETTSMPSQTQANIWNQDVEAGQVLRIDMKHKSEEEILTEFLDVSGAKVVHPSVAEMDALRELEEQSARSEKDSERSKEVRAQWKKEQAMLAAARGDT